MIGKSSIEKAIIQHVIDAHNTPEPTEKEEFELFFEGVLCHDNGTRMSIRERREQDYFYNMKLIGINDRYCRRMADPDSSEISKAMASWRLYKLTAKIYVLREETDCAYFYWQLYKSYLSKCQVLNRLAIIEMRNNSGYNG